jgi:hypothetical protein
VRLRLAAGVVARVRRPVSFAGKQAYVAIAAPAVAVSGWRRALASGCAGGAWLLFGSGRQAGPHALELGFGHIVGGDGCPG